MKTKIVLASLLILAIGMSKGFSQNNPTSDDKIMVMKEIEEIREIQGSTCWQRFWKEATEIEELSFYFGYSSYGIPWMTPALHGGTLGFYNNHFMIDADFGVGSLIDENTYDNSTAFEYLKSHSTQGFAFLSAQYYPIKYLSFGAGLGFHTELQKDASAQTSQQNQSTIETDKISFVNKPYFGLRLKVAIYVPVSDKVSIYLSTGYDVMPSDSRKNKLDMGLGLKIAID